MLLKQLAASDGAGAVQAVLRAAVGHAVSLQSALDERGHIYPLEGAVLAGTSRSQPAAEGLRRGHIQVILI